MRDGLSDGKAYIGIVSLGDYVYKIIKRNLKHRWNMVYPLYREYVGNQISIAPTN